MIERKKDEWHIKVSWYSGLFSLLLSQGFGVRIPARHERPLARHLSTFATLHPDVIMYLVVSGGVNNCKANWKSSFKIVIIIIILFHFYIALNTNVSQRFTDLQIYYYPGHWIQYLPAHIVCTISTPWGSIAARRLYLTLKNCLTNNDGRILLGWRVASAGQYLAK